MSSTWFNLQAEDGIRAGHVTGVQTSALPLPRRRAGGVSQGPAPDDPARLRAQGVEGAGSGRAELDEFSGYEDSVVRCADRRNGKDEDVSHKRSAQAWARTADVPYPPPAGG